MAVPSQQSLLRIMLRSRICSSQMDCVLWQFTASIPDFALLPSLSNSGEFRGEALVCNLVPETSQGTLHFAHLRASRLVLHGLRKSSEQASHPFTERLAPYSSAVVSLLQKVLHLTHETTLELHGNNIEKPSFDGQVLVSIAQASTVWTVTTTVCLCVSLPLLARCGTALSATSAEKAGHCSQMWNYERLSRKAGPFYFRQTNFVRNPRNLRRCEKSGILSDRGMLQAGKHLIGSKRRIRFVLLP